MIELVLPSARYRERYLEALAEYRAEGAPPTGSEVIDSAGFDTFVAELHARSDPAQVPAGNVPRTTWWLMTGDRFPGRLAIRHALNDAHRLWGGHILCDIRPTEGVDGGYGPFRIRRYWIELGAPDPG